MRDIVTSACRRRVGALLRLIYEDAHIEVFFRRGHIDLLVATFNPGAFLANGRRVWGAPHLQPLGCSLLGFMAKSANWFPAASMQAARVAARRLLARHSEIMTFGYSLGAYGALKYGKLLHADITVAFAPQNPTLRAAAPHTREALNPQAYEGLDLSPDDLGSCSYIFFDPLQAIDGPTARSLAAQDPRCMLLATYGSGHNNIKPILKLGMLPDLITACRAHDVPALSRLAAQARRASMPRPAILAPIILPRWPNTAAALFDRYGDRFSPAEATELNIELALAWLRHDRHAAAVQALQRAAGFAGDDRIMLSRLNGVRHVLAKHPAMAEATACSA